MQDHLFFETKTFTWFSIGKRAADRANASLFDGLEMRLNLTSWTFKMQEFHGSQFHITYTLKYHWTLNADQNFYYISVELFFLFFVTLNSS